MNVRLVTQCAVACAMSMLMFAGSASAQWATPGNGSDAIEGGVGGVSVARCGSTVVAGFADAESSNPNSFAGVAVSKDGGKTFSDLGVLPTPPVDPNAGPAFLGNDFSDSNGPSNPALACGSSNLIYYASTYRPASPGCGIGTPGCTAISISTSTNGGATWGLPVVTSQQGADTFD